MHRIVASPAINMIDVKLSGFMPLSEVQELESDFRALFRNGKAKPGYKLLVDIAACAIQSQDSLAAMVRVVNDMPKATRIAVICASPVLQMQLGRVMRQSYLRVVPDRQAALAWLTREIEPARAA